MNLPGRMRRDHGRVSVFFAVVFTAAIVLIGLAVDGAGKLRAVQRANHIAAEAARAAGQAIDAPEAIVGGVKMVDPERAAAAARDYLDAAEAQGDVAIAPSRRELTVTVTITYDPLMLGLIGIGEFPVTGRATAVLVTG